MVNKITDEPNVNLDKLLDINSIAFNELFPDSFIKQQTNSINLNDFFKKSGFIINSKDDFRAIPDEEWEKYIIENTNFKSWNEMQKTAHKIWVKNWLKDKNLTDFESNKKPDAI